jgi:hypothetical protein
MTAIWIWHGVLWLGPAILRLMSTKHLVETNLVVSQSFACEVCRKCLRFLRSIAARARDFEGPSRNYKWFFCILESGMTPFCAGMTPFCDCMVQGEAFWFPALIFWAYTTQDDCLVMRRKTSAVFFKPSFDFGVNCDTLGRRFFLRCENKYFGH